MAILLEPNSRKFLVALADLNGRLRLPANAVQVAAAVAFDARETSRSVEELLRKRLVHYAGDIFGEWVDPNLDIEPLMLTRLGRQVIAGTA